MTGKAFMTEQPQRTLVSASSRSCKPASPRSRVGPSWTRLWAVFALAAMLPLVALPGTAAGQGEEESCPVVAVAQGVQVTASASDNIFLAAPTGIGAPVTRTCVDYGVKTSNGFASSPYPGETVLSLSSSRVDYPAHAASRYPGNGEAKREQNRYSLSSTSTETSSKAEARTELQQEAASAIASAESVVNPETRTATATAASDTQPLAIKDVLQLGEIQSSASAEVGADGKIKRNSALHVGRTMVGEQVVEITPEGVHAAGQTVASPAVGPVEALEAAGIRIRYLQAEQHPRGILSAGIDVMVEQQHPDSGAVYTVHYTFGRTFAAVQPVPAAPDLGVGLDVPMGGTGPETGTGTASGSAPVNSVSGDSMPAPAAAAPPPGEVPAAAPPPALAQGRLVGNPSDMGVAGLYLVIVFGSLAMFASATLLRLLGVKTRWTS